MICVAECKILIHKVHSRLSEVTQGGAVNGLKDKILIVDSRGNNYRYGDHELALCDCDHL